MDALLSGTRILVADDDVDSVEIVALIFERIGAEVRIASDGLEALEIATLWAPDVLILDIVMPRMDGYTVAGALRLQAAFESVPILAVTACASGADVERALSEGFDAHVAKPFDADALVELVTALIAPKGLNAVRNCKAAAV